MSILQVLEESLHSDAPCYMEFLYRYDPKKQQCFAFYEGDEDSSFYHHFLKEAIGDDCALEEIVAGCKNNIIKLHKEFNWGEYSARQNRLLINDGNYYLLAYNDGTQDIRTYRIDRMKDVKLLPEAREGKEAFNAIDLRTYTQRVFSMFSGEKRRVICLYKSYTQQIERTISFRMQALKFFRRC